MSKIGTRSESSLHRQLKLAYAGSGERTEVGHGRFVADGVSPGGARIEVQIGSFERLRKKAGAFAALPGGLKVVHPIAVAKYLEAFGEDGAMLYRRKSNRPGKVWDVFYKLVYAPELPRIPGLEIELALADVAEERVLDGKGSRRRKGASIRDRRLLAMRGTVSLSRPCDYLCFVPFARGESFTSADLARAAGIRSGLARKALYVLWQLGIVEKDGRRGNAIVYRLIAGPRMKKWRKPPKD